LNFSLKQRGETTSTLTRSPLDLRVMGGGSGIIILWMPPNGQNKSRPGWANFQERPAKRMICNLTASLQL